MKPNGNSWIHPKDSTIRIRPIINQTILPSGERVSFGESYLVTVPATVTGKGRVRQQFAKRKDAEEWAERQYAGTIELGKQFFNLEGNEPREAVAAWDILRPLKLSLLTVATEYAQAHVKLAGRTLVEAVDYFIRHKPADMPNKSVDEVHLELMAAKRKDGVSDVYLKDLEFRNGRFAISMNRPIAEVTASTITDWLRNLKCGARGRNNYRRSIKTLFAFAEARDYLTKDHVNFDKVAKAKEKANEIEIFTADELSKLLTAAQLNPDDLKPGYNKRYATGRLLPLLVFGAFAGLRTAEIERQRWEDVLLDRGFIRVTAAKGNTAAKRLVPISDNLKQWLCLFKRSHGLVSEVGRTSDCIARLAKRAGVEWRHNALRHSFGSYRLAEVQSAAQVSLEMGNSPRVVFKHYREVVLPKEAKTWFSIAPSSPANVARFLDEAASG